MCDHCDQNAVCEKCDVTINSVEGYGGCGHIFDQLQSSVSIVLIPDTPPKVIIKY